MMRRLIYSYVKPQHYYGRLMTFFCIIGLSMTLFLTHFNISSYEIFLLKFIVIIFLLLSVGVFIEFLYRGEYMDPLEVYDVEFFFHHFMKLVAENPSKIEHMISKYDFKSRKNLYLIFSRKKTSFILSSIRKHSDIYEITFINSMKLLEYFIVKFFVRKGIHKLFVKKHGNGYKIIGLH